MNNHEAIGITVTPSTTQAVTLLIQNKNGLDSLKNKLIYFDLETSFNSLHRAIGFIHEITTRNSGNENEYMHHLLADPAGGAMNIDGNDTRVVSFTIISTFSQDDAGAWSGNKPLPTSPSSGTPVYIADQKVLDQMFSHHEKDAISYLGTLRGGSDTLAPLIMPYYGGNRGASSMGFVGRTGSGKTDFASKVLINMMKYPDHFTLTVDPQGQWGSEVGFTISPQRFAEAMGRKVYNLRVSEHIQLPLNEDNLLKMLSQIDLWAKVGRMAKENRDILSQEVSELICSMSMKRVNACVEYDDYKDLLADIFEKISGSSSTIARIYASEDKQNSFRLSLSELTDPAEALVMGYVNSNSRAIQTELKEIGQPTSMDSVEQFVRNKFLDDGIIKANLDYDEFSENLENRCKFLAPNEKENVERRWRGILNKFIPLINLFQSHNMNNEQRQPLAGHRGFLNDVLKVRNPKMDDPAPYVVLDMSPDVTNKAKEDMLGENDPAVNMRRLLDNESIKASILMMIFSSLKESAEEVFLSGGGNLNTQILFDEAWRYAPDNSENDVIKELSSMLEGFALDTRKFGIGWTYILQSPSDLRQGIWKQLKYVFAGYGLVGADLKRMSDLMDDASEQLKTYKQFVAPDLTGEYPFMLVGSLSPLITAQVPLFINSYTSVEKYVSDNYSWMRTNMVNSTGSVVGFEKMVPIKQSKKAKASEDSGYLVGGKPQHEGRKISTFNPEDAPARIERGHDDMYQF